jgi:hypothetical protein
LLHLADAVALDEKALNEWHTGGDSHGG